MTPPDQRSSSEIVETVNASLVKWRGWSRVAALLTERPEMVLYLAGGALRDLLAGLSSRSNDLDFFFAEESDLDDVAHQLGHEGRIERNVFGSPRWYPAGEDDLYCDLMAIRRFHNGLGRCRDILDVLGQFDFSGNAMALDLRSGRFFDPFDGASDLRRHIMRAIRFDHPDEPLVPGHDLSRTQVLWLRLVHYTALLGLEIEPATLAWLREHAPALRKRARFEEVFHRLHPRTDEVLDRYGLA
jgi:tRNA nucleotidyltransferase (CCA-adding enzyme)